MGENSDFPIKMGEIREGYFYIFHIFIQFFLHRPTLQCRLKLHQRQVTVKSNNLD